MRTPSQDAKANCLGVLIWIAVAVLPFATRRGSRMLAPEQGCHGLSRGSSALRSFVRKKKRLVWLMEVENLKGPKFQTTDATRSVSRVSGRLEATGFTVECQGGGRRGSAAIASMLSTLRTGVHGLLCRWTLAGKGHLRPCYLPKKKSLLAGLFADHRCLDLPPGGKSSSLRVKHRVSVRRERRSRRKMVRNPLLCILDSSGPLGFRGMAGHVPALIRPRARGRWGKARIIEFFGRLFACAVTSRGRLRRGRQNFLTDYHGTVIRYKKQHSGVFWGKAGLRRAFFGREFSGQTGG